MAKPTVTATDRLANVMDVVELGRRTGLLRVERGSGTVREDGEVYFVQGRPIYAAVAGLRGREALRVLALWGICYFSFDAQVPQPIPNISGVLPAVSSPSHSAYARSGPNGPNSFGMSGPSGPRPQTPPGYQPGYSPPPPNFGASGAYTPPSGSLSSGPSLPWGASGPNRTSQPGSASANEPTARPTMGVQPGQPPTHPPGQAPGQARGAPLGDIAAHPLAQRQPKRATDVRDLINVVTTFNLARSHRTILLLADGEHTIQDISRLSGKPVEDVVLLLRDLEERRLVYYHP
jgi:hypothetical protein